MIHQLKTVLCLLLITKLAAGQQISPQTINSTGKSSSNGNIIIEDAIGGLVVTTITTATFMYTQDFIQPDAGATTTVPQVNDVALSSGSGIDNAGTTFIAGNTMIEFTVGEAASITLNSTNNQLSQGILQPYAVGVALPVTGLEFYAKRLNNTQVQIDWKTQQEINNKGFYVERKKENENAFIDMFFVNTSALNGNSSFKLDYQKIDNNNFTGNTYYRLRQEDLNGKTTYSLIRIVKGTVSKQLTMQVWPVPAVDFFNITVNGLEKNDFIQVIDINGRLVKQLAIQNQTSYKVSGLPAGTYFVKLVSDKTILQKVIVQ
jgi:hypothetical protein